MDPPPASLEAMVRSKPGSALPRERDASWRWVVPVAIVISAVAYYVGLHR